MRLFTIILVLALGFSGFLSTAHAFEVGGCDSSEIGQQCLDDKSIMADQEDSNKNQKQSDSKEAPHVCLNCGHCSTAHATAIYNQSAFINFKIASVFNGYNKVDLANQFIFSIKRPPKFIV